MPIHEFCQSMYTRLGVLATDPGSVKDFQAFARQTGNQLLSASETDQVFEFFFRRK